MMISLHCLLRQDGDNLAVSLRPHRSPSQYAVHVVSALEMHGKLLAEAFLRWDEGDALQYSIHGVDDIHDAHIATQLIVENQAFPKVPQTDPSRRLPQRALQLTVLMVMRWPCHHIRRTLWWH